MTQTDACPLSFSVDATDGAARTGTPNTPHGAVETPAFMAVGNAGGLKDYGRAGTRTRLRNYSRQYLSFIITPWSGSGDQLGGLQEFSGWRGPMLTDSGGYQVFSPASMRQIDEEGVRFKSHLDGSKLLMTAESSIATQSYLGADIIMAFDECPAADASHDYVVDNLHCCIRWLDRPIAAWQADDGTPGYNT